MVSPSCLIDTNVLIRFADPADPLHETARRAVRATRETSVLQITSQNLVESWNVMTRPRDRNGFGQTIEEASAHLDLIERLFQRIADPPDLHERWREIVRRFRVRGVQVHDARLAAIMSAHGTAEILTFNGRDFERYSEIGIRPVDPNTR